jgi:hypothetical protein
MNKLKIVGVKVYYNVVHLRTSLVQLFVLILQNFEKVVQMIELKRFGGAPNGYPFAPLKNSSCASFKLSHHKLSNDSITKDL